MRSLRLTHSTVGRREISTTRQARGPKKLYSKMSPKTAQLYDSDLSPFSSEFAYPVEQPKWSMKFDASGSWRDFFSKKGVRGGKHVVILEFFQ